MIIKTFVGESSAEALKRVRTELGGDAVVLATRRVADGSGRYNTEVTACLDAPAPQTPVTSTSRTTTESRRISKPVWNRMTTKSGQANTSVLQSPKVTIPTSSNATTNSHSLTEQLRDLDIPETIANELCQSGSDTKSIQASLSNQIAARIGAQPRFTAGDRVLVVGPAGSGKTSIIAKLAAQCVAQKLAVTVTGIAQEKIGAIDELLSIADLTGADFQDDSESQIVRSNAITLIDCGTQTFSELNVAALRPSHTLFVFPATWRTSDLQEFMVDIKSIGITGLIMTMLDRTHRLGGIFVASDTLNAPLVLVSTGSSGTNSLSNPKADQLASRMLTKGARNA